MRIRSDTSFCIRIGLLLLLVSSQLVQSMLHLLVDISINCLLGDSSDDSSSHESLSPNSPPKYASSDDAGPPGNSPQDDDDSADPQEPEPTPEPIPPTNAPEPSPPTPVPIPPTSAPDTLPTSAPEPLPPTTAPTPEPIPSNTPAPLPQGPVILSMKLLLIGTSATDTYFLSAKLTLDSVGATYDNVFVGSIPELTSVNGGKHIQFHIFMPRY
jgi:hypothetical protein